TYFDAFDSHFYKVWEIVSKLDKEKFKQHQRYYQHMLHHLLEIPTEINRHIHRKPLGYSGDFMIMNYIYNFNGNNYLGGSSYEMLINNYTCNIPVSCSNVRRKEFFKGKILETINKKNKAVILSIGSGPLRELTELLEEGKINKPLLFKCLDFEKRALDYVSDKISKLDEEKKHFLTIEYIQKNIIGIIKDTALKTKAADNDFVYISGVFDYLSERICSRLIKEFLQSLKSGGTLIVCNADLENSSHRAYYELLGEWNMLHRTKKELLSWTEDIKDKAEMRFENIQDHNNYLFYSIKKV
ncbi:hypothetical protein ACFL1I_07770, partial [Candidatus Omnitrophota bacterium]